MLSTDFLQELLQQEGRDLSHIGLFQIQQGQWGFTAQEGEGSVNGKLLGRNTRVMKDFRLNRPDRILAEVGDGRGG